MRVNASRESVTARILSHTGRAFALLLAGILCFEVSAQAATSVSLDSPTGFFTNVAARLLRSELQLDLNQLQVYPTNYYTPSAHRLLQLTANLYDSTTNRILGLTPEYPYCPSVFRPLFRRISFGTNTAVVIAGYREVTNTDLADPALAPIMVDLSQPDPTLGAFPSYGTPFLADTNEPMVSGIPLVIGAKKGFPNFNEFAMQTEVDVSRFLEFRRNPGDLSGPVTQTNQMYVIGISNVFGLEAWNSYLTNYPRDLKLTASVSMTAILTNEFGQTNTLLNNTVAQGVSLLIASNTWSGWSIPASQSSMVLPFGNTNGFLFLTNSSYIPAPPWLVTQTHTFSAGDNFYVPHWWLNLKTRLLFILEDTEANRIVDYVNLNQSESTVDVTAKLMEGASLNPLDYHNPANEWITNRIGNSSSINVPTYGVVNQIQVGLNGASQGQNFGQDPYAGLDVQRAVDSFRYNLISAAPIYPQDFGIVFYKSNMFYAPFIPYRPFYVHISWQANDPLVHYLSQDLQDLTVGPTSRVDFLSQNPPLYNLSQINARYRPWGGNPIRIDPVTDYQIALKDPFVIRSDDWDFPSNQPLGVNWVGKIHRGTPWQTVFLKSTNVLDLLNPAQGFQTWIKWTGDSAISPITPLSPFAFDASLTLPTNDWHIVGLLNELFNTNSPSNRASPNLTTASGWESLLDGIQVSTNFAQGQFTSVTMSSNSPQAAFIAQALLQNQSAQPGRVYSSAADILSTPALTVASPWLNSTNGLTDDALEAIPAQLLPLLRSDSIGAFAATNNGAAVIQFSGIDGNAYTVQASSDLIHWVSVSTNFPSAGLFYFTPQGGAAVQFFRSKLLP